MPANSTIVFQDVETVSVEERPVPEPAPDEVLVETTRSLISTGTELAILTGDHRTGELPIVPGYCNVGTVVETGENVDDSRIGQQVASLGKHQAYVTVSADSCQPLPDGVTDEEATFAAIGQIAMNGVRRGRVDWGETVGVYGAGLVGQLTARYCHLAGAHPVVGFDIAESRLDLLPDSPGVVAVNPAETDSVSKIETLTDGRLADVVFEVTANVDIIPEELALLRDQGRFVVLSSPRESGEFNYYDHCHRPSYEIIGAHGSSHPSTATIQDPWTVTRHRELFLETLAAGRIEVASLVTHRDSYREAPDLFEMLLADRTQALGVVLEW